MLIPRDPSGQLRFAVPPAVRRIRHHPLAVGVIIAAAFLPSQAWAHRDDYIDETFVYQTLERGEFEFESWGEVRGGRGQRPEGWYTGAFESGITSHWMVDGALQWVQSAGSLGFGRLRGETRVRFAEEGTWPLDIAASLEYEMESRRATGGETEHTVTPRLVVSKDVISSVNTTLNLDFPVNLGSKTHVSFAYAVGVRFPAQGFLRAGVELKHMPAGHLATIFPQLWFALPAEITFKIGAGIGLTSVSTPLIGRAVFEVEF